jgi:cyclin-C
MLSHVHINKQLLCTYHGVLKVFRGLVNDTYKMDLILIYPPYMIALACIYIASVLKEKDTTAWFEELRVDMNVVFLQSLNATLVISFL